MRVRREHMGRSSTGMGKNAQVRCVAEGFQARLLFEGQVDSRFNLCCADGHVHLVWPSHGVLCLQHVALIVFCNIFM